MLEINGPLTGASRPRGAPDAVRSLGDFMEGFGGGQSPPGEVFPIELWIGLLEFVGKFGDEFTESLFGEIGAAQQRGY